jgi:hypothetical protein
MRPWSGWNCWPAKQAGWKVLGDTAYGTGQASVDPCRRGHTAVIKPGPLRPAVTGGFTIDDFTVDDVAGTATCPAGVTHPINLPGSTGPWPSAPSPG